MGRTLCLFFRAAIPVPLGTPGNDSHGFLVDVFNILRASFVPSPRSSLGLVRLSVVED